MTCSPGAGCTQSTMAWMSALGVKYCPAVAPGDRLVLAGKRGSLVGHLEEQQEGELLEVILVGEPVVAQDVAVRPEFLDDAVGDFAHAVFLVRRLARPLLFVVVAPAP